MLDKVRKASTAFRITAVKKTSLRVVNQSSSAAAGVVGASSLFSDQDPDEIGADMIRHRPSSLKHLASTSGFSEEQLKILYRGFKQVCDVMQEHPLVCSTEKQRFSLNEKKNILKMYYSVEKLCINIRLMC